MQQFLKHARVMAESYSSKRKLCFVTIGATASFDALLRAILSTTFLTALVNEGYSDLLLQYGKTGLSILNALFPSNKSNQRIFQNKLNIAGFDFDATGLTMYMRCAKGDYVPPENAKLKGFDQGGQTDLLG